VGEFEVRGRTQKIKLWSLSSTGGTEPPPAAAAAAPVESAE
jgi:hypothetical protein